MWVEWGGGVWACKTISRGCLTHKAGGQQNMLMFMFMALSYILSVGCLNMRIWEAVVLIIFRKGLEKKRYGFINVGCLGAWINVNRQRQLNREQLLKALLYCSCKEYLSAHVMGWSSTNESNAIDALGVLSSETWLYFCISLWTMPLFYRHNGTVRT